MTTGRRQNRHRTHSDNGADATAATRIRKRDRIRSAVDQKTLGVAAIATLGAIAAGAIGVLGFRRIDADRLKADPDAKPLADEIRDRASSTASHVAGKASEIAGDVMDRASEMASDVRDTTRATVHDIGKRAGAIKDEVIDRTRLGDPTPARKVDGEDHVDRSIDAA